MRDICEEAAEIANAVEKIMDGKQSASCLMALGMLIASSVAKGTTRDLNAEIGVLQKIAEGELKRQFTN